MSIVELPKDVRDRIDWDAVVGHELTTLNRLLPPRWGDLALRSHERHVVNWFKAATRRGFTPSPDDTILARKVSGGARPLTFMSLLDRLSYRAAVSVLAEDLPSFPRTHDAYEAFQRAPLAVDGCAYVLKSDVSAFYQYIDHERLVTEIIAQTGDDLAITTAIEVIRGSTGRQFGLPQLNLVSDALAEVYIEPIRRHLTRAGFNVWRFADDFRVACETYEEALEAWELLDRAARDLGLVLNEAKTRTPGRARYEASLTAVATREAELFSALGVEPLDPWDTAEYSDEDGAGDITTRELWPGGGLR
ncbi:MAG TPA: RNA-directed DNA polymerase [Mycobacteriales bacterium]